MSLAEKLFLAALAATYGTIAYACVCAYRRKPVEDRYTGEDVGHLGEDQ